MTAVEDPFYQFEGWYFLRSDVLRFKIPHVRRASLFPRSSVNKS